MADFEKFSDESLADEEVAELDALVEYIGSLPNAEVMALDPIVAEKMKFCCAVIKKVLRETNTAAKIECKQSEFERSVGVVRVEGVSLEIADAKWFSRAAEFATNTEVYPLTNGKVRMTFTFHGFLKEV